MAALGRLTFCCSRMLESLWFEAPGICVCEMQITCLVCVLNLCLTSHCKWAVPTADFVTTMSVRRIAQQSAQQSISHAGTAQQPRPCGSTARRTGRGEWRKTTGKEGKKTESDRSPEIQM
eukprot:2560526-Rhodomonas_salina.1